MMKVKRIVSIVVIGLLLVALSGCKSTKKYDVTPSLDAIESISFQRTNIDENNQYTYFEKNIEEADAIQEFCKKLDKISLLKIDPIEFSSVDYLIVFQGKLDHKLMICQNKVIYDGQAYEAKNGDLLKDIAQIYNKVVGDETPAQSKLFQ